MQIKQQIGVQLQRTSLLPDLRVVEQVMLFSRLYGQPISREQAIARLEKVGLEDKANAFPDKLSGGQQQRLALALALVNNPEIVFLDEPTTGLDPQSRRALWEIIRDLVERGKTVVLTTHYMEEAEALCHRVGIIDHGKIIALDTPGALVGQLESISTITTAAPLPLEFIRNFPNVVDAKHDGDLLRIQSSDVLVMLVFGTSLLRLPINLIGCTIALGVMALAAATFIAMGSFIAAIVNRAHVAGYVFMFVLLPLVFLGSFPSDQRHLLVDYLQILPGHHSNHHRAINLCHGTKAGIRLGSRLFCLSDTNHDRNSGPCLSRPCRYGTALYSPLSICCL